MRVLRCGPRSAGSPATALPGWPGWRAPCAMMGALRGRRGTCTPAVRACSDTASARLHKLCRGWRAGGLWGVVVLWLVLGGGGLVGEVDVDGLLGAAFLLLGEVGQGLSVRPGEGWLQDAAWPQAPRADDVDLGGVQGGLGGQVQPRQQPQDDGEEPVDLAGVFEVVADQVAP